MAFSFWKEDPLFLRELSVYLQGKNVLEVFAGNGYLAKRLLEAGVNVRPTSIFKSYDMSEYEMHSQVEEMTAKEAILKYGEEADVLLMSWPEAGHDALKAAIQFFNTKNGDMKKLVYIGERTCYQKQHLGGCASDLFFTTFHTPEKSFSYQGRGIEVAEVLGTPEEDMLMLLTSILLFF